MELLGEEGQQAVGGRFLHERDQRFDRAKSEAIGKFFSEEVSEAKIGSDLLADSGDEHAPTDRGEKGTAFKKVIHNLLYLGPARERLGFAAPVAG